MHMKFLWLALALTCITQPAVAQSTAPLPPVNTIAELNVPRYMGTWYEVAKFPNRFQVKCIANTRARYLAQTDGTVQVPNSCLTADGSTIDALGVAQQVGGSTSPKLQVRFAPAWLGWLPQVWGDYWVIDLDADYQMAAVSDATREFLWILSRNPQVSAKAYSAMVERLKAQHFDVHKLERTTHH
jgi:apolipoprotein D and lipocalin family protein